MEALAEPTLFDVPQKEDAKRSRWTPENDEILKRMFSEGASYGVIAGAMTGFSRNAVIGRAHRLGLGSRMEAHPPRERKVPSLRRAPRRKGGVKRLWIFDSAEPTELPPDHSEFAVGFHEAKDSQCRYPLGDTRNLDEFRFCGAEVHKGYSYCTRHCRIVFEPPQQGGENGRGKGTQFECSAQVDHRESGAFRGTAFRFG